MFSCLRTTRFAYLGKQEICLNLFFVFKKDAKGLNVRRKKTTNSSNFCTFFIIFFRIRNPRKLLLDIHQFASDRKKMIVETI